MTARKDSSYPDLYVPLIWASYAFALFGGFSIAMYLSLSMGYGWVPTSAFQQLVELHAHLQLFEWMGLLLIGVSLYVLPRLMSYRNKPALHQGRILLAVTSGALLKVFAVLMLMADNSGDQFAALLSLSGAILEASGIALYLLMALRAVFSVKTGKNDLKRLSPYFFLMFSGWIIAAAGSLLHGIWSVSNPSGAFDPALRSFLNESFVRLTLVPAIFAFGVKMLPVFLGLRAPLWPVRAVGQVLACGTVLYLAGEAGTLLSENAVWRYLAALGTLGMTASILAYIWFLDALLFRILPERISLKVHRSDVHLQRGRYGDKGEFGRFELFVVTGFAWLALVALGEGANALGVIFGLPTLISRLALRHALLLGALAHLVLGVSHRLLPNLLSLRLVSPYLTSVSFIFVFTSSLLRVLPVISSDWGFVMSYHFFALSGVAGFLAVLIASINLLGRGLQCRVGRWIGLVASI